MSDRPAVKRHHWIVRLTHWLSAILLVGLIASGLQIYGAFPNFGPRGEPYPVPNPWAGEGFPEWARLGAGWLKVKPVHTLDLVVLAAEWGHGRRRGWLSNLHLGARHDTVPGEFVMLGKTFKGLTDAMLAWQTERLLALATERGDWVVRVRPELVVEIAFDGIQTSPRYPGGVALRFARVLRHRPDKRAEEADTLASVLAVRAEPG